jgi:prevent-host-death family protein
MKSIDLQHGVVPISRAASSLAALIKRSRINQQPIIITQKGYPSGVLLGIELYSRLQALAEQRQDGPEPSSGGGSGEA